MVRNSIRILTITQKNARLVVVGSVCTYAFAETTSPSLQPHVACIVHNGMISRKSPHLSLSVPAFRSHCACAEHCQALALGKPPNAYKYKGAHFADTNTVNNSYGEQLVLNQVE